MILQELGRMDIYLLDQFMKGRIHSEMKILDAGCGTGRNSEYFIRKAMDIYGIDKMEDAIHEVQRNISNWNATYPIEKYTIANLEKIPFPDQQFDFIISSAVLHFAASTHHFIQMFDELIRVLQEGGILFIRMTTTHTIDQLAQPVKDGVYQIPDGSIRYLLNPTLLKQQMQKHHLQFLEPFKTTNVNDIRTMATIVLKK